MDAKSKRKSKRPALLHAGRFSKVFSIFSKKIQSFPIFLFRTGPAVRSGHRPPDRRPGLGIPLPRGPAMGAAPRRGVRPSGACPLILTRYLIANWNRSPSHNVESSFSGYGEGWPDMGFGCCNQPWSWVVLISGWGTCQKADDPCFGWPSCLKIVMGF